MQPQVWDALRNQLASYPLTMHAPALPGYAGTLALHNIPDNTPDNTSAKTRANAQATAVAVAVADAEAMVDFLVQDIVGPVALCGWSLGAMLAMLAAQRHPNKISHLILFAATPSFVSRHNWPHGVTPSLLETFSDQLAHSPTDTLMSFIKLFNQGDFVARRITRYLHSSLMSVTGSPTQPSLATLKAGLSLLATLDMRQIAVSIQQPCLLLHGQLDSVMPVSASQWLVQAMPDAQLAILPQAAHAPFLSDPEYCTAKMANFLACSAFDEQGMSK